MSVDFILYLTSRF